MEYLTTGAPANARRAIVALVIGSALFSWLGAFCAQLLARERERAWGKRTVTAVIAGLILGLGAVGACVGVSE